MKKTFLAISIIILLCAAYIIAANTTGLQPIYYAFASGDNTAEPPAISINIALYSGIFLIAGLIAGAGVVYYFLAGAKTKIKAYERELEKSSVKGETNASKVDVLEAKIKTLETALNSTLEEKTKLENQIKTLYSEQKKSQN